MSFVEEIEAKVKELENKFAALWERGEHGALAEVQNMKDWLSGLATRAQENSEVQDVEADVAAVPDVVHSGLDDAKNALATAQDALKDVKAVAKDTGVATGKIAAIANAVETAVAAVEQVKSDVSNVGSANASSNTSSTLAATPAAASTSANTTSTSSTPAKDDGQTAVMPAAVLPPEGKVPVPVGNTGPLVSNTAVTGSKAPTNTVGSVVGG